MYKKCLNKFILMKCVQKVEQYAADLLEKFVQYL